MHDSFIQNKAPSQCFLWASQLNRWCISSSVSGALRQALPFLADLVWLTSFSYQLIPSSSLSTSCSSHPDLLHLTLDLNLGFFVLPATPSATRLHIRVASVPIHLGTWARGGHFAYRSQPWSTFSSDDASTLVGVRRASSCRNASYRRQNLVISPLVSIFFWVHGVHRLNLNHRLYRLPRLFLAYHPIFFSREFAHTFD